MNTSSQMIASFTAYNVVDRCMVDSTCVIPESKCEMNVSCDCFGECLMNNASTCQSGTSLLKEIQTHSVCI